MTNPIFELSFWRERLADAVKINLVSHAIGQGFNFQLIDEIHKQIVNLEIKPEEKVLDAGCGYGRIAHWFSDDQYTGVDFVPEFIEIAKQRHPTKRFLLADIRKPKLFPKKSFDWGVCISMKEMIRRDAGEEVWRKIEDNLLHFCGNLLILEYGNNRAEEIWKYEII